MLERSTLSALLGPTNTGKTHRAVERMLEHESGMLGLPLRLLAREIYDRITARIGESEVALVTGEEKRVPARARYFVCTVEAMPVDRTVDFLAVDEIQLCAHRERGHVFTDRLLNARGRRETWFLGSDTLRPLLQALVPTAEVRAHPRLSRLTAAAPMSIGQLPPRSAVVAFSMSRVYEIAERLKRRRGGVAVVLGALSPRARNAQVAMYQSGEVDHMVATDAIGMGLNLDLLHVAFADLVKYDGREARPLEPAELAQIAGRAGRHLTDGTFGTLAPLGPLAQRTVRAMERHAFPPERKLVWRSTDLDTSSLDSLIASLRRPPRLGCLELVREADDFSALIALAAQVEIRNRCRDASTVELLWDACQIPDYRQLLSDAHARLVESVFLQLADRGRIEQDFLASHVRRLDDVGGDIDALLGRMAFIRTWTYVSSHADWVNDPGHWQELTRSIEDRLSDALHTRLVERFVEKSRPARSRAMTAARRASGHPFAALAELRSPRPEPASGDWVAKLADAPHDVFVIDSFGRIGFGERVLGVLTRGPDVLRPEVRLTLDPEDVAMGAGSRLQRRLVAYARDLVSELFQPLRSEQARCLSPAARGLAYQVEQHLGTLAVRPDHPQLTRLTDEDRRLLGELELVLGRRVVYLASILSPSAMMRRAALFNAHAGAPKIRPPPPGVISFRVRRLSAPERTAHLAIGYCPTGPRAVRVDALEKALARLALGPLDSLGRGEILRELGCPDHELDGLLRALGAGRDTPGRRRRRRRRRPPRSLAAAG